MKHPIWAALAVAMILAACEDKAKPAPPPPPPKAAPKAEVAPVLPLPGEGETPPWTYVPPRGPYVEIRQKGEAIEMLVFESAAAEPKKFMVKERSPAALRDPMAAAFVFARKAGVYTLVPDLDVSVEWLDVLMKSSADKDAGYFIEVDPVDLPDEWSRPAAPPAPAPPDAGK